MTDRTVVINEEQRAVDHAYDCYERRFRQNREKLGGRSEVTDSHAGTAFIPDVAPEVAFEDDLGGAPLVVGRVDAGGEDPGTWHLGRRVVFDESKNVIVVDWRNPRAHAWMLARQDDPGEVRLSRRLDCRGRKVLDYSDIVVVDGVETDLPGAPTIEGLRDLLLEDLERARDDRMRDIVATIQREQMLLVSDEQPGVLVVQGGPGTGKTAIGLHRISWLLFNERFRSDEVLVVGPHRGFLDHVREVLPQLGTRGVTMVQLDNLWNGPQGNDSLPAQTIKSDARMAEVLRRAVGQLINSEGLRRHMKSDAFEISFEGSSLAVPREKLEALLEPGHSSIAYFSRRLRFGNGLVDLLVQEFQTAHPTIRDGQVRTRLERHRQVAQLINAVAPNHSPEHVLGRLLSSPAVLRSAAEDVLSEEEQRAIQRPHTGKPAQESWSLEDRVCLEELRLLLTGESPPRYRHIVVDEAQDLTPMQARSLARRCPSGSMTVLGDLAQSTGLHSHDGWPALAETLAGSDGWHLAEITVGYRVPHEVMEFAAPLAENVSPKLAFPQSIRPAGKHAVSLITTDLDTRLDAAVTRALDLVEEHEGKRSVALIVPEDLLSDARQAVRSTFHDAPVHVVSALEAKSLEYDHVVLIEPSSIAQEKPSGLGRLYVAITRCTQSLTIIHAAPLPAELLPTVDDRDHERAVTTTNDARTSVSDSDFQDFISSLEKSVRDDRKCHVHEQVRFSLIAELHKARLRPVADSPTADVISKSASGLVLYEVLGEGTHSYGHMREAVLRIMEIQHAEGERADHHFIVLACKPKEAWAVNVLWEAFNVSVIWQVDAGWDGHRVPLALGIPES